MRSSPAHPVRILVTGFGPFPGVESNASGLLVTALGEIGAGPALDLHTVIIPVIWSEARAAAHEAIARTKPHAVVHFGVAKRLAGFEIETRAINLSGPKKDHAGAIRPAKPLLRPGPLYRHATLPPALLLRALRQNGFPAQLSKNAGRYLCNAVLYWTLTEEERPLAAFVHMPALGVQTEVHTRLTFDTCLRAAQVLVRASAQAVRLERHGFPLNRTDRFALIKS